MPMRQKELRLALICYGGVSLAVYMHGITKEVWHLARASKAFHSEGGVDSQGETARASGSQSVYLDLLRHIEKHHGLRLRVLPDIIAGASAGGINGVFLAQAISSGQSLDPLTDLWLEKADIDVLLDPDARPFSHITKFWAQPLVWLALSRPGNVVSRNVAKGTRNEVRGKLSRLIRARWFAPPFSGTGFSRMLLDAFEAMAAATRGPSLLPPGQPLDLFVTATDFHGHLQTLKLNSPPLARENEHRLSLGFRCHNDGKDGLGATPELVFAARATASFPGAFPPLVIEELDRLLAERGAQWPGREAFFSRIVPHYVADGTLDQMALIDGSVLSNAPFAEAIRVLKERPAHREIDRRFVYIDPKPDRALAARQAAMAAPVTDGVAGLQPLRRPGFLSTILGSISGIPREQPIRDNLEAIAGQSERIDKMRLIIDGLRDEIEETIEALFGRTWFFDSPTQARLAKWRNLAQTKAAEQAGYAFNGYAQVKLAHITDQLARTIHEAAPAPGGATAADIRQRLWNHLSAQPDLDRMAKLGGGASAGAIAFFRAHDIGYRIRRMRLVLRRLAEDSDAHPNLPQAVKDRVQDALYRILAHYLAREGCGFLGNGFGAVAAQLFDDPAAVLDYIAARRDLLAVDSLVDGKLATLLEPLPADLRRRIMLTYLGFPFYDVATLPLLQGEGLDEFDPIKVDRISPADATSIRDGAPGETLRGLEFYSFGAFFSRSYRENDYLWGRLHGAERMIDLMASTLPADDQADAAMLRQFKRAAFNAILDEEQGRLTADPDLVSAIRAEVEAKFTAGPV